MIILEGANLIHTIEAYQYYLTLLNSNMLNDPNLEAQSLKILTEKRDKTNELLVACKVKAAQEIIENDNKS